MTIPILREEYRYAGKVQPDNTSISTSTTSGDVERRLWIGRPIDTGKEKRYRYRFRDRGARRRDSIVGRYEAR